MLNNAMHCNIHNSMDELQISTYSDFHQWSVQYFQDFWQYTIDKIHITFHQPYSAVCDLTDGVEYPQWFAGATLNIAESCFHAHENTIAIISQQEAGEIHAFTYQQLDQLSNRVANSLIQLGVKKGDAIAIILPLHFSAIAIYLGIIKCGAIAVSIAESFAQDEIVLRCQLTDAKWIFTQDVIQRNHKLLPLYEKTSAITFIRKVVLSCLDNYQTDLQSQDIAWENFLSANDQFTAVSCVPNHASNYLFSSGTTGEPKTIIWDHTTPIKCASDAFYHCDVKPGDVLCMPTSLGWMMGPWLVYASLINRATIAIFDGSPTTTAFGEFIQHAKVTTLGVVPSLVSTWRASECMKNCDWHIMKLFFSTGECSNSEDMQYLMSLANNSPIIEYCGGTEIGGAYITSTLLQPNIPGTFTTPTLGLDFIMLDEHGNATDDGEVALIPPSIGLSTVLLNRDHHQVYFQDMPHYQDKILRRHGDHIQKLPNGYYRNLGRMDDTMNLGGIKVSSAEIERVLITIDELQEVAAVAITPPLGGPSLLVIYAVLIANNAIDKDELQQCMQQLIKTHLNPLFKIHDIIILASLPRTASNKILRRSLRECYCFNAG